MKDTFYRIETTMRMENPELSGSAMITCNGGILFAELHPVRIKAKVKEPCEYCETPPLMMRPTGRKGGLGCCVPKYCFNCGRRLVSEEAQP